MNITAPQQDVARIERTRDAWRQYAESLHGLAGRDYEEAEHAAWDQLQMELADIAAEHATLTGDDV